MPRRETFELRYLPAATIDAGDDSLRGSVRFGDNDTYARLSSTTPEEVMYSSVPINDTHDIVYRLRVTEEQPAGDYQTSIKFLAIPVY